MFCPIPAFLNGCWNPILVSLFFFCCIGLTLYHCSWTSASQNGTGNVGRSQKKSHMQNSERHDHHRHHIMHHSVLRYSKVGYTYYTFFLEGGVSRLLPPLQVNLQSCHSFRAQNPNRKWTCWMVHPLVFQHYNQVYSK